MGKATLARQRANGLLGQGRIDKLYDEGKLIVLYADDYKRLRVRLAELERENALLRAAAEDGGVGVPIQMLREAMRG